jgi:hypothetical protein
VAFGYVSLKLRHCYLATHFAIDLAHAALNIYGRPYSGQLPAALLETIDEK